MGDNVFDVKEQRLNLQLSIARKELSEVSILRLDKIDQSDILSMLKKAYARTIFVVDQKDTFQGIITGGDYVKHFQIGDFKTLINKDCVYVYDGLNTIDKAVMAFCVKEIVLAIPVVNDQKKLLYVLGRNPYYDIFEIEQERLYNKMLFDFMNVQRNEKYNINHYLQERYTNIAIWGINYLTIALGEAIKNDSKLNLIGLFGPSVITTFDLNNTTVLNCIFYGYDALSKQKQHIDILIIGTTTIYDCLDFFDQSIPSIYVRKILMEIKFLQSDIIRKSMCKNLNNIGVETFRIRRVNPKFKKIYDQSNFDYGKFDNDLDKEEFIMNREQRPGVEKRGDIYFPSDYHSRYINCLNGERLTFYQPQTYNNTIFLIGHCAADGVLAMDKDTVGSSLQKMIRQYNLPYKVRAFGLGFGIRDEGVCGRVNSLKYRHGDIVVFFESSENKLLEEKWEIDMTEALNNLLKKDENCFWDESLFHCNYKGYQLMAEEIFKKLQLLSRNNNDCISHKGEFRLNTNNQQQNILDNNFEINAYVQELLKHKVHNKCQRVGSIVMNCNPFTKGHRYLIEKAREKVDFLYIFVVEEDLSYFKFKDRFELVKSGLSDLDNIQVIPSGRCIISSRTFSAYFEKDSSLDVEVDSSLDVEIFARYIAPALDIAVRFVGKEPFDYVTNQYNQALKEILPDYGVQVIEVPRKMVDGDVISASNVRQALKEGDWEKIKNLVPKTTFGYLKEKFQG